MRKVDRRGALQRAAAVFVVILVMAGSPASAVSGLDALTADSLCNVAQGLGALSLLSFMGGDALNRAAKNAPSGPPNSCGTQECEANPAHCAECAGGKYSNWQREFDEAGSKVLNTAGKMLGYGAGLLGVACTAPSNDDTATTQGKNDNGND